MKKILNGLEYNVIIFMCGVMLALYVFGMILHDILIGVDISNAEAGITVFPLGTVMAVFSLLIMIYFTGATSMCQRFGLLVSIGATRKEFFADRLFNNVIATTIYAVVLVIMARIETSFLCSKWAGYSFEFDLWQMITWKSILLSCVVTICIPMLIGSLILHFGKAGFWVMWVVYMIGCIGMSKGKEIAKPFIGFAKSNEVLIGFAVVFISLIAILISWLIVRKESVKL